MDLLTQLDTSLDLLLRIMSSSIAYISRKALHTPLPSSTVPLTVLGKTEAIDPVEMDDAIAELVSDLVDKAQSIREIIQHLPTKQSLGGDQELETHLKRLQEEMRDANQEYSQVRLEVDHLRAEVEALCRVLAEERRVGRGAFVKELEGRAGEESGGDRDAIGFGGL
ncbi:uncharacterized protein UHOD_02338 [Ustilago sp. UG-2017b]|nr:uncharacterized protein UHOD_02338 [Ustilago sp. UG-2017b]